jgi:presenilin-like A22 family membrane protease
MTDEAAAAAGTDVTSGRSVASRLVDLAPQAGIGLCYLATVLGGMALADETRAANLALFQDPGNVGNVGVFAGYVLVGTVAMLLAFRYGRGETPLRLFMAAVFGAMAANAVLLATGTGGVVEATSALGGLPGAPVGVGLAAVAVAALWFYPEWYVVDVIGILAGAALIPMLGLGFGPLPIVVLLVLWAGYDAYAVYGSGHMKELAGGVGALKVPVVFVVPTEWGVSFRDLEFPDLTDGEPSKCPEGDATGDAGGGDGGQEYFPVTLLGLGDAIIPGMLAVSAGHFLDAPIVVSALNANAPALGALLGGIAGLLALVYVTQRFEGAHAGLPPLNAGVLGGYFVGTVAAGLPLTAALGL